MDPTTPPSPPSPPAPPPPPSPPPVPARRRRRWQPTPAGFILLIAAGNACIYQGPLYAYAIAHLDATSLNGILTLATLFLLVGLTTALMFGCASLLSHRLVKPVCMAAALGNAIALYFVQTYQVVLDKAMMGNVFNTNIGEAGSYLHYRMLWYLLLFGIVPCWLLARIRIRPDKRWRRAVFLLMLTAAGAAWFYANARTWLWFDKNASRLGGMILPWSYVFNAGRYGTDYLASHRSQTLLPAATFLSDEPTIVVLVIGEAARRQDFSLYGYARNTNPQTAAAGVAALPRAQACATYTTAAVACILSHAAPGSGLSQAFEPLPSYLSRHGIDVVWRTNNWGEPPLAVQSYQRAEDLRRDCQGEACAYDEVLLQGLAQRIGSSTRKKIFVVLHQGGSHGPSYASKYPPRFDVFQPVCRSVDLTSCSNADLLNAYDNTILYTDHFIAQTIGLLKRFPRSASVLIYLSDHGESLGEHGLYLHGTPFSIAPDVQKDIPFLVWRSARFANEKSLVRRAPHEGFSQQDVFHSVMGAFDMRSPIYRREHDIFEAR